MLGHHGHQELLPAKKATEHCLQTFHLHDMCQCWTYLCRNCCSPSIPYTTITLCTFVHDIAQGGGAAGPAGSYVSGSALVVDGAQWLYKKPGVPMDVVLKASKGEQAK